MTITPVQTTTTRDASPAVAANLPALRSRLAGDLITPADPRYDEARRIANTAFDRYPLAIVRVAGAADVAEAVRFARYHGYPLAVRSGGHSVAGHSAIDGAILVDLSSFKGIAIDPVARTARVQAGATSGDLAGPANSVGLALSTGDTASVGLGGLTTGGGVGYMVRKHGLAIDNLLSAEIVTAEGTVVTASPSENHDLFWAIRGGGGNFGIITEFRFRLAPVGDVYGGALILPATREVLRGYLDYIVSAPDELTTIANVMHAPPAPFIPEDRIGETVLMILACWSGDSESGERAMAPLRALAEPVVDAVGTVPYPSMYDWMRPAEEPHANIVRQVFAQEISDTAIDEILEGVERATSPMSMIQLRGLGGALARVPRHETAYAHRDANYFIAVLALWMDPTEDPTPHRGWAEALWESVRKEGTGAYVNFLADEGAARIREAYPEQTYQRLVEVKKKWDPTNFFRFNQNIRPR